MQVTKDYRLARVSGPLTYNDITTASSEGRRDIWTDRERGWDEAEAIDTGQNRPPTQLFKIKTTKRILSVFSRVDFWSIVNLQLSRNATHSCFSVAETSGNKYSS